VRFMVDKVALWQVSLSQCCSFPLSLSVSLHRWTTVPHSPVFIILVLLHDKQEQCFFPDFLKPWAERNCHIRTEAGVSSELSSREAWR
jgi:hypothetical protein